MKSDISEYFIHCNKKRIFWIAAVCILVVMVVLSFGAGMSGDEASHCEQAHYVYNYYKSSGKVRTAIRPRPSDYNQPYYGQFADNFAYFITRTLNIEDEYAVRHCVNSCFGWLAILFAALIAYNISGWRAAMITLFLMFLSPRFLGHSFNNLKDVPFAAMMTMGLYYIILFIQQFPKVKIGTTIMLTLSIGLAIAVRVGGLLLIPYFGLFALVGYFIRNHNNSGIVSKTSGKEFLVLLAYGIAISATGYAIGVLLWPYAMQKPIANVVYVFKNMSRFSISIKQIFEGKILWSSSLPWYYTPKYILITVPVAVLIGYVLNWIFLWGKKYSSRYFLQFVVNFAFLFPLLWIVITKANVYGGWRHSMFVYPPMVITSAIGYCALIDIAKNRNTVIAFASIPFILLIFPLVHIVRNHPYEYVYFNELVGGVRGAYGNYEMDYYYHSQREATEWILKNADVKSAINGKITIATWHPASVNYYVRKQKDHFNVVATRWSDKDRKDWDYAIFSVTGIDPDLLKSKFFPPSNAVKVIRVSGKPICVVLKRKNKLDYEGYKYQKKMDYEKAIDCYSKYIEGNSFDESVLLDMIISYKAIDQLSKAKKYIDDILSVMPNSCDALFYLGLYYIDNSMDTSNVTYDKVMTIVDKIRGIDDKSYGPYMLSALLNNKVHKYDKAIENVNIAKKKSPYELWIYQFAGDIYYGRCMWAEADSNYSAILELDPKNYEALISHANACTQQGKFNDAGKSLKSAESISQSNAYFMKACLRYYLKQNRMAETKYLLSKFENFTVKDDDFNLLIAEYYYKTSQTDKAYQMLDSVLLSNPDNAEAKQIKRNWLLCIY